MNVAGHAGYAEAGSDIVCSAVSILVFNTINSIEAYTEEKISINGLNRQDGVIDCSFPKRKQGHEYKDCTLLLNSMILGLETIEQMYGEYIKINHIKNN
ncbi:MAG: ribosomal-processing cysteine protease Prp [Cellulosilyticaceae bacterium]